MKAFRLHWLILASVIICSSLAKYKFTKIDCEGLDESIGYFEYCRLKAVNRSVNYVGLRARLFKTLKENITLHYQMMKRENGWKPFLYNITIDICKFLQRPNNPVIGVYYKSIRPYTNLANLKCPFEGTIIIDNLTNAEGIDVIRRLPFPSGKYAELTSWYINNVLKAKIDVYGTVS